MFLQMLLNNFYSIACNEYEYLLAVQDKEFYQIMCAQCQQIIEKLLKHLIYLFCLDSEEAKTVLKTHNLVKLNLVLVQSGIDLNLNKKDLSIIKDYYFITRYPGDDFMILTREDYVEAKSMVDEVLDKVKVFLSNNDYCTLCGLYKSQCECHKL